MIKLSLTFIVSLKRTADLSKLSVLYKVLAKLLTSEDVITAQIAFRLVGELSPHADNKAPLLKAGAVRALLQYHDQTAILAPLHNICEYKLKNGNYYEKFIKSIRRCES
jgi:hypothetical protein